MYDNGQLITGGSFEGPKNVDTIGELGYALQLNDQGTILVVGSPNANKVTIYTTSDNWQTHRSHIWCSTTSVPCDQTSVLKTL
eukprot:UN04825